jgi:hypothetical protein
MTTICFQNEGVKSRLQDQSQMPLHFFCLTDSEPKIVSLFYFVLKIGSYLFGCRNFIIVLHV